MSDDRAMGIPLANASDEAILAEIRKREEAKMKSRPPRKKDAVDLGLPASKAADIIELDASKKD